MGAAVPADAPRRRRRGPELQEAILRAALQELATAGWAGFSVESVAARAGTGKAAIYRRWPTREALVADVLDTQLPAPRELGVPAEDEDVTTAEALHRIAQAVAQVVASPVGEAVRAVKFESLSDPDLARIVDERFQAPRRAAMVALLRRGVERGEVRPGADTGVVADVLPALLVHRLLLQREHMTPAQVAELVDQVIVPMIEARR